MRQVPKRDYENSNYMCSLFSMKRQRPFYCNITVRICVSKQGGEVCLQGPESNKVSGIQEQRQDTSLNDCYCLKASLQNVEKEQ